MEQENTERYWSATRSLMFLMLFLWMFFAFGTTFRQRTQHDNVNNFPLGFYMAAQGSLIAFVISLILFAWWQDKIDRRYGMAEDE